MAYLKAEGATPVRGEGRIYDMAYGRRDPACDCSKKGLGNGISGDELGLLAITLFGKII